MPDRYIQDITAADFGVAVLQRSQEVPVVVDFWAEWCGPCKTLGPLLERVTAEHNGAFELVKIDVDQNQQLAAEFGIQSIPTVVAFRHGVPISRFSGAVPEHSLQAWLTEIMPSDLELRVEEARDLALDGNHAAAEAIFREVLDSQPDQPEAGIGLASLRLAAGDAEEALIILGRLTPTPEVERLQGAARMATARGDDISGLEAALTADPNSGRARIMLARALAARNEFEPALDHYLHVVRAKGKDQDEARLGMLDIFGVLGDEHPLTATYRRQLASALF
jgi:putative thioredoxin